MVSLFETPPNDGENYDVRLSGYLAPPVSGDYVFYHYCPVKNPGKQG